MKKLLVLSMVLVIAIGSLFAIEEPGQWGGNTVSTGGDSATLKVNLDLTDGINLFNVGFASEEVSKDNINTITPQEELSLVLNGSEYTGSTYIYYGIKDTNQKSYTISIDINDALTASSDSTGIDWSVSASPTDGGTVNVSSNSTKSATVWNVSSSGDFTVVSAPLSITTIGFLEDDHLVSEIYSGTIKLTIAANN